MGKVLFSSWAHKVIDNRGKAPETFQEAEPKKLPEIFAGNKKLSVSWDGTAWC
jgi:hypothetical protein